LAGLILGLSHPAHVSAKPPDLPIILEDVFAQPVNPDAVSPEGSFSSLVDKEGDLHWFLRVQPASTLSNQSITFSGFVDTEDVVLPPDVVPEQRPLVSHEAQRTLASCLLVGVHPSLGLIPTSPLVEEYAARKVVVDFLGGKVVRILGESSPPACGFWFGNETWVQKTACNSETIEVFPPICFLWHSEPDSGVEVGTKTEGPSKSTDTTMVGSCPWMRHHFGTPPVVPVADPVVTRDVLANLESLLEAEELLQVAQRLLNRGMPKEAIQCYEMVSKMCPGSWLDETARAVCAQFGKGDSEECEPGKSGFWFSTVKVSSKPAASEAGVHEEVTGLIKACRLAVEMGRYQKAIDLVREAYALDAQRITDDPVLCKIHQVACHTLEYCVPCAVLGHVFGCKFVDVRLPSAQAATVKEKGNGGCFSSGLKADYSPGNDESCEPWGVSDEASPDEPVGHAKGKGNASCCCGTASGVAKTGGEAVGEPIQCPIFFTLSPCTPCGTAANNQGGCVGVQVWFVPAGMEVRTKPNVTKKTCPACAGQTACCKEPMVQVSIPDVELVGDQVRVGWQVLVGSWTCQVRYDRSGLSVQTQTTPCGK
jgi:hypothetical protein